MDLSGLKWPIIIAVVVAIGWLLSSGGTNYMYNNFTKATPGADAARDKTDEAGLSRLGWFMMRTFRYKQAMECFQMAVDRYPNGANYWYNQYRMAKCAEKNNNYQRSVSILRMLIQNDAHALDSRVPVSDNLKQRSAKLVAVHEL